MKNDLRHVDFRYDLLNKNDIKKGELNGITGKISYGEFRTIKRTAVFNLDEYLQQEIYYLSDQIQPWFILHMPDGGTVEWPLGIFLLESPNRDINGKIKSREIGAYDKTIIIEEDRFTSRYFISAGTNYIGAINKILTTSDITKIKLEDSELALRSDKEFPVGTKKKEAINELLNEINYNSVRVDEEGYIHSESYVEPAQRSITQTYSANKDSIILLGFTDKTDISNRANVFVRVAINLDEDTELKSEYTNDDPLSTISTVSRGRRIVDYVEIDNIANQEALDNLVRRIAIESTSAYTHFAFKTGLMPTHGSAETLFLDIPDVFDAPQKFSETSWEMDLKFDGEMQHEARKVIQL